MELRTLPLEGIRPILSMLPLLSIVRLHMTLDKSIQRLLSASGAFTALHIPVAPGIPPIALRYFLRSVRNVAQLSFDKDVQWSNRALSLLAAMNPAKIVLTTGLTQLKAAAAMKACLAAPNNARLCREVENLSQLLLPNFTRLTPQLESLSFQCLTSAISKNYIFDEYVRSLAEQPDWDLYDLYCFPPALTSFQHNFLLEKEVKIIIETLPATLISFDVTFSAIGYHSFELHPMFTKFTRLAFFSAVTIGKLIWPSDIPVVAPESLNRFQLRSSASTIADLMKNCNFRNCTLFRFDLRIECETKLRDMECVDPQIDLQDLLPSSLLELSVAQSSSSNLPYSMCYFPTYPKTLTSLALRMPQNDASLSSALASLPGLTDLWLGCDTTSATLNIMSSSDELQQLLSAKPSKRPLSSEIQILASDLPRKLLHLECEGDRRPLSYDAIRLLPAGLRTLTVRRFDYTQLPTLAECLYYCQLKVTKDIGPLTLDMMIFNALRWNSFFRPTLDLVTFSNALVDQYAANGNTVHLYFPGTDRPFKSALTRTIIFNNRLVYNAQSSRPLRAKLDILSELIQKFQDLLVSCSSVTKIVLQGVLPGTDRFAFSPLPPSLEEIDVSCDLLQPTSLRALKNEAFPSLKKVSISNLPNEASPMWLNLPDSVLELSLQTSHSSFGPIVFPRNLKELTLKSAHEAKLERFSLKLSSLPSTLESLHVKSTRPFYSFEEDDGSLEHLTLLKYLLLVLPSASCVRSICERLPSIHGLRLQVETNMAAKSADRFKELAQRYPFIELIDSVDAESDDERDLSDALASVDLSPSL